jgi:hypothetical protein
MQGLLHPSFPKFPRLFNTSYNRVRMNERQLTAGMASQVLATKPLLAQYIDKLDPVELAQISTARTILLLIIEKALAQTEKDGK